MIPIAMICDENYIMPTAVTITSIKANHKKEGVLIFHIITDHLSEESQSKLKDLEDVCTNIVIHQLDAEYERGVNSSYKSNLSATAISQAKFDLDVIIPNQEKILYLDSDLIVLFDVEDLYSIDIDGFYCAAVPNLYDERHCKKLGVSQAEYFNTGVLLLNTSLIKKDTVSSKLHEYKDTGYNAFMDQDAFNVVFKNRVKYLSFEYNLRIDSLLFQNFKIDFVDYYHLPEDYTSGDAIKNAKIIHYCTKYKPWKYRIPLLSDYFEEYYYSSPFRENKLHLEPYKFGMGFNTIKKESPKFRSSNISIFIDCNDCDPSHVQECIDSIKYQTSSGDCEIYCYSEEEIQPLNDVTDVFILSKATKLSELVECTDSDYVMFISGEDYLYQDAIEYLEAAIREESGADSIVYNYRTFDNSFKKFDNYQIFRYGKKNYYVGDLDIKYATFNASRVDRVGLTRLCSVGGTVLFRKTYFSYRSKDYSAFDWRSHNYASLLKSSYAVFLNLVLINIRKVDYIRRFCSEKRKSLRKHDISVVLPAYNVEKYIDECLVSLFNQTHSSFEVIIVDDCSTDSTLKRMTEYLEKANFNIVALGYNYGPGISRNIGFTYATGEYLLFLDSDDYFDDKLLEELYIAATINGSDVSVCKSIEFDSDSGKENYVESMYRTELLGDNTTIAASDCFGYIFNVFNGWAWDKLIKKELLVTHNLSFLELRRNEDMVLAYMSLLYANHFSFVDKILIHHRRNTINSAEKSGVENPFTFYDAGTYWIRLLKKAGCFEKCLKSYRSRMISALWYTISMCKADNSIDDELFCKLKSYMLNDLDLPIGNRNDYHEFVWNSYEKVERYVSDSFDAHFIKKYVKQSSPEITTLTNSEIKQSLGSKKVIVSMTSYPLRIEYVASVVESLLNQTYAVDRVILWLAKDQFKDVSLPKKLMDLTGDVFSIEWCDEDLKSHKKYYYAFKKYPRSIIITVDDDVRYDKDLVRTLLISYVRNPTSVSAMRVHKIVVSNRSIAPYEQWIKEYPAELLTPFLSIIATGVGGVLYPPNCMDPAVFDKKAIIETCLYADDLWLKVMELRRGTPVVLAAPHKQLDYLDGSQSTALYLKNVGNKENDLQLGSILKRYPIDIDYLEKSKIVKKRSIVKAIIKKIRKIAK